MSTTNPNTQPENEEDIEEYDDELNAFVDKDGEIIPHENICPSLLSEHHCNPFDGHHYGPYR